MNHQDYLAALDRLRRVAQNPDDYEPYSSTYVRKDKALVYDFEHDDTPATVEWLENIGVKQANSAGSVFVKLSEEITAWDLEPGVMLTIHGLDVLTNPTCGEVLTLLRVFSERKV